MRGDEFTGTLALVRFIVRRDRVRLVLWIIGFAIVMIASASSLRGVYADPQAIGAYAELVGGNPAMRVFVGPGYGFDDPSIGVILVAETQLWGMVAAALMSAFLVVRQTRAEEESGTVDLLLASVLGRHAPLAAAGIVVGAAHAVLACLVFAGFVAVGYEPVGSLAIVLSIAAVGWLFAALAVVFAQIASGARAALGGTTMVLALTFVVRAAGDAAESPVRWVSPIGWAQGIRAFTGDEAWWTLAVSGAALAAAAAAAVVLAERRDIGSGFLAHRDGATAAGRWARRPVGLVLHLQRNALAAWTAGFVGMGAVYGLIADEVDALVAENPVLAEILTRLEGASPTDAYLATAVAMLGVMATGWAVSAMLTLRTHEIAGRAGLLLTGPLARLRWFGAHVAVTLAGSMLVLVAAGTGVGVGYASVTGDAADIGRTVVAAVAIWPAHAAVAAVTACIVGWLPRYAVAAWGVVVFVVVVGFLGELLDLPAIVRWWSPFEHVGRLPVLAPDAPSIAVVVVVAAALGAIASVGFRRRDLTN